MGEWTKKLVLIGATFVFIALFLEGGLHLLQAPISKAPEGQQEDTPKGFMRYDNVAVWFPREGERHQRQDPYGQSYVLRINATGQRGSDIGARRLNERRILFIGDSFTMGSGLREEDTFVAQVGNLLAPKVPRPIQTINGGVDGYNTFQELAYYRYYGKYLDPDIVVLCFFVGNDFRDNAVRTGRGRSLNPVLIPATVQQKYKGLEDPFLRNERGPLLDPLSGRVIAKADGLLQETLAKKSLLFRLLNSRWAQLQGKLSGDLWAIDLENRFYFYEIGLYQQRRDLELEIAVELTLAGLEQLSSPFVIV